MGGDHPPHPKWVWTPAGGWQWQDVWAPVRTPPCRLPPVSLRRVFAVFASQFGRLLVSIQKFQHIRGLAGYMSSVLVTVVELLCWSHPLALHEHSRSAPRSQHKVQAGHSPSLLHTQRRRATTMLFLWLGAAGLVEFLVSFFNLIAPRVRSLAALPQRDCPATARQQSIICVFHAQCKERVGRWWLSDMCWNCRAYKGLPTRIGSGTWE